MGSRPLRDLLAHRAEFEDISVTVAVKTVQVPVLIQQVVTIRQIEVGKFLVAGHVAPPLGDVATIVVVMLWMEKILILMGRVRPNRMDRVACTIRRHFDSLYRTDGIA